MPLDNARFALNAANGRWGSLFDALYGTDALGTPKPKSSGYDPARGSLVFQAAFQYLDRFLALEQNQSWSNVVEIGVEDGKSGADLVLTVGGAGTNVLSKVRLTDPTAYRGRSASSSRTEYLLQHHRLHLILVVDRSTAPGKQSKSGLCDVVVEAAVTSICDMEDSVTAVDADDKVRLYAHWLGLMDRSLTAAMPNGKRRSLAKPKTFQAAARGGDEIVLPGTGVLLIRNVGLWRSTDAVLFRGAEVPEGLLDLVMSG